MAVSLGSWSPDVVVVGAGHNGLVAANVMADKGWRVLILEAQPVVGGAVRHDESLGPGLVVDLFSSFYPLGYASPVLGRLGLDRHGLSWTRAPVSLAHVLGDGCPAAIHADVAVTADALARHGLGRPERWLDAAGEWERLGRPLLRTLLDPFPPLRGAAELLRAVGSRGVPSFARRGLLDALTLAEELVPGRGSEALLVGNALHADLPATSPGSGILGWLLTMLAQDVGFPVPVGGSGRITDALMDRLRTRGGRVLTGHEVVEVLERRGRVAGVRVNAAGGTGSSPATVSARVVLADVTWPDLVRLAPALGCEAPGFRWDHATVKVNWAVEGGIPWADPILSRAGTVHLAGEVHDLADGAHDLALGRVPRHPFVLLGQPSAADPSRRAGRRDSVWAYTHLPRAVGTDRAAVDQAVRSIENVVGTHAPGFLDAVVGRLVQTPADLQAADCSLSLGALNAGTAALHQQLVLRPRPGWGRPSTAVRGLYLAGASAHPGGGVHGAPGHNAARAALADLRLRRV